MGSINQSINHNLRFLLAMSDWNSGDMSDAEAKWSLFATVGLECALEVGEGSQRMSGREGGRQSSFPNGKHNIAL